MVGPRLEGSRLDSSHAAGAADDGHVLGGKVTNPGEVAASDGLGVDQGTADTEAAGAGFEETLRGRQVDAAGGHESDLGERAAQGLQVRRTADVGRKDLDDVGA